jgi:polyhydroxyalkanoate synthesis regulator phasin
MSNPLINAFFVGRSLAEAINEQIETTVTNALSDLGKFDAEQRVHLRQFIEEVLERAKREEEIAMQGRTYSTPGGNSVSPSEDLQATIDELRAEVAQLRSELQRYRSRSA